MSWTGLYCGTGASVVTIASNGTPYMLMQREVQPDGELDKWSGTGGSVREDPISFPETSDPDVIMGYAPGDSEFREAATRETWEETNRVIQLDPNDLVLTKESVWPNKKPEYSHEYIMMRSYAAVLGPDDHNAIQEAIDSGSISGHVDTKGTVMAAHVLVPLADVLKLAFPPALAAFDSQADRAAWKKFRGQLNGSVHYLQGFVKNPNPKRR